jgi:hypothetical protein
MSNSSTVGLLQASHPIIHANVDHSALSPYFFRIWSPVQTGGLQYNTIINIDNVTLGKGRYRLHADILAMAGEQGEYCTFDEKNLPKFDTYFTVDANGRVSTIQTVPELSMSGVMIMAFSFVGLVVWARVIFRHQMKR